MEGERRRVPDFRNRLKGALEALLLLATDLASLFMVFEVSYHLRVNLLPKFYGGFPEALPAHNPLSLWWVFLIWMFFLYYEGLYTRRLSYWDEVKALWKAAFFATVGIFAVTSAGKLSGHVSRTVAVIMGAASIVFLPCIRLSAKRLLRRAGLLRRRVLILGAGETGRLILRALRREPNYGYRVVGYLDDDPAKVGRVVEGVKVHRGVDRAARYIRRCNITDLVIAMPGAGNNRLRGLIDRFQHQVGRVLLVPDVFGMAVMGTTLQHFFEEQAMALEVRNNLAMPVNYITKRVFDCFSAIALFLLLLIPLMVISALIRITSKGPAIFRQERIGRNGRPFMCYKFRTMYPDAEARLGEILKSDPRARVEWETNWKLRDDPRVTPIGRFLRRTSLDELPQVFNVLKGEMSLIGPRPYLQREKEFLGDSGGTLLSVLPGITGLWQVSGRSTTGYGYRIALDSWYVRNWNLWLDIVILLKTFRVVFRKEGAF